MTSFPGTTPPYVDLQQYTHQLIFLTKSLFDSCSGNGCHANVDDITAPDYVRKTALEGDFTTQTVTMKAGITRVYETMIEASYISHVITDSRGAIQAKKDWLIDGLEDCCKADLMTVTLEDQTKKVFFTQFDTEPVNMLVTATMKFTNAAFFDTSVEYNLHDSASSPCGAL